MKKIYILVETRGAYAMEAPDSVENVGVFSSMERLLEKASQIVKERPLKKGTGGFDDPDSLAAEIWSLDGLLEQTKDIQSVVIQ